MSEHRRAVTHLAGSTFRRRRRWLLGAAGALGVGGLILGGVGVPASAGDANAGANVHATADVSGGCLTAVVGTGGADGSVQPQQDPTAQVEAAGQGTVTASVCPGDPAGALPDSVGGFVPSGSGLVPGILDLLPEVVPGIDAGEPGGSGGDGPAINPAAGGTVSGSVAVGGIDAEGVAPTGQAPGGPDAQAGPGATGTDILPGGTLPRTGGGLGTGVLRLIAVLGFGRAALGLVDRRRRAGGGLASAN